MNYLWDTNLLVHYIRTSTTYQNLNSRYNFFGAENQVFISIVTMGEIYSLAKQRKWQEKKLQKLATLISHLNLLPIARQEIVVAYAEIDAYSQGKLEGTPLPTGMSARNMGKNDVWIAATAHHLNLTLVTSDKDFDHLQTVFIQLVSY